jgi:hypothetical protein
MSEDLDLLIQNKETELDPLLLRMDELRLLFVDQVVTFTAKWFEDTAQFYVLKRSEVTLNMGKERLSEMKTRVKMLVKNSGKIVKEALSDTKFWWHKEPHKDVSLFQYEQIEKKFPELLDKPIRQALGHLGVILEEFGYGVTVVSTHSKPSPEYWFIYPQGPDDAPSPYFPHLLVWSEEMQRTMRRYNELYKQALGLFIEIHKLKEEKERRKAIELWNST